MPRRTSQIAAVTLAFALTALAGADGWTHYAGGAARRSEAADAPRSLRQPAWSAEPAADEEFVALNSPIVCAGRVFVAARRFEDFEHVGNLLIAYDAASGERLWSAVTEPDVFDSWSSAALDERLGAVIVASGRTLYAFDVHNGASLWQTSMEQPVVNASPAITNDLDIGGTPANRVFIADYRPFGVGTLYAVNVDAFDAANNPFEPGQTAWSVSVERSSGGSPAYKNGVVVMTDGRGAVAAYRAVDGGPLWQNEVSQHGFFGGATIGDDAVYAASYNFDGGENNSQLYKLDLATGELIWQIASERSSAVPILTRGGLILLSAGIDGFGAAVKVQAFRDLDERAELLWDTHRDTRGRLFVGGWTHQPLLSRGLLYAGVPGQGGSFDTYVDLLILNPDRSPADSDFIVARHAGSGGSPAAADGWLYSIGVDGLFAFSPAQASSEPPSGAVRPTHMEKIPP